MGPGPGPIRGPKKYFCSWAPLWAQGLGLGPGPGPGPRPGAHALISRKQTALISGKTEDDTLGGVNKIVILPKHQS